jgi:TolB-like protein/DNA-binding winged helix-turn-helix (wHTH) protein/Flp pilus assembly protein TadD
MWKDFSIGDWVVRPSANIICRANGVSRVRPKSMEVLVCLARARGEVVTKQRFFEEVWGQAVVSDDVLTQAIVELRRAFDDSPRSPSVIETVPRTGYRLIPRVSESSSGAALSAVKQASAGRRVPWIAAVAGALTLGLFAIFAFVVQQAPAVSERITRIAVLPFDSLSLDPNDAFIAAGVQGAIIRRLAQVRDLTVIARTSVLSYAGARMPVTEIAQELGAGAIVEGSVQYDDQRVKVVVQLVDGHTGTSLWAAEYLQQFDDIFAIQADIARQIVASLQAELANDELARLERPVSDSAAAYALYIKALEGPREGRLGLLSEATEIDPEFAMAYVARGEMHMDRLAAALTQSPRAAVEGPWNVSEEKRLALADFSRALVLDPGLGRAYAAQAMVHANGGELETARRDFDFALELSPNDGSVLEYVARFELWTNELEDAREHLHRLARVDPRNDAVVAASFLAGDMEQAYVSLRRFAASDPANPQHRHVLGLFHALRGDRSEAASELELAERLFVETGTKLRSTVLARMAYAYGRVGRTVDAGRLAARVFDDRGSQYADRALASLAIGNADEAFEWMTKISDTIPMLGFMNVLILRMNLVADPVLDEPRFRALRERAATVSPKRR